MQRNSQWNLLLICVTIHPYLVLALECSRPLMKELKDHTLNDGQVLSETRDLAVFLILTP